ncbi:hypothetical protein LguiB_033109 [Lonicera macranthoides]
MVQLSSCQAKELHFPSLSQAERKPLSWVRTSIPAQGKFCLPFSLRHAKMLVVGAGEWWHADVEEVVKQGNNLGLPPNMSDAHTINGKPGPLFPCSEKHTFAMEVESGKTYLLRIINAALNDELFFAVANHTLTVVEIDAVYTKPFTTQALLIAPGQPQMSSLTPIKKPTDTSWLLGHS